jgi:hypothetical protein
LILLFLGIECTGFWDGIVDCSGGDEALMEGGRLGDIDDCLVARFLEKEDEVPFSFTEFF